MQYYGYTAMYSSSNVSEQTFTVTQKCIVVKIRLMKIAIIKKAEGGALVMYLIRLNTP